MRVVLILFVLTLAGCSKENNKFVSRFTLLNAVPNSNAFTLEVGGALVDSITKFGVPDFYREARAATTTVRWKHIGTGGVDSTFFTDVSNNTDFLLLFYDSLDKKKVFFSRDVVGTTSSADKAYLRFFPLVISDSAQRITNDTSKVLVSRNFGTFSAAGSDFTAVDTINTKLRFYLGNKLVDSIPGVYLKAGKRFTIFAVGVNNQTGDKRPRLILYEH